MSESLSDLLRNSAKHFGARPAVAGPTQILSYAELDSRSDEIGASLLAMGVYPGARVGIFRKKDTQTVASIYGALKAGCAYVPLDPKMGSDRLAAVLGDAGLAALIVDPALASRLQTMTVGRSVPGLVDAVAHGDMIRLREAAEGLRSSNRQGCDDAPAYVLYTSGSTGIPKGVQHTHASALAFVRWAAAQFDISSHDRLSCHAPFHFDLTIFDLFVAAMTGACVVLIPEEAALFPFQVASILESERITVWYSVPFALTQLVSHGNLAARRLALRELIFAGERFPPRQLLGLAAAVPGVRLSNLFGPTETNVCAYHHLTSEDIASDDYCPIGTPCPYASVAIMDQQGNRTNPGRAGELFVGGSSLMTGYLNRPQLNANAFVNMTSAGKTGRFFRTGDLVTWPKDGPMRFHGRIDRQVKVRGVRIELDEVEAALVNCPGVIEAAAWLEKNEEGFGEVRAVVQAGAATMGLTGNSLIMQIRPHLPQAAVPAQVFVLSHLPRTVNGKIDYVAVGRKNMISPTEKME